MNYSNDYFLIWLFFNAMNCFDMSQYCGTTRLLLLSAGGRCVWCGSARIVPFSALALLPLRCPALSVQHRERRTAPDPPRKTPQTAAEALQPASSTSTRPTGKIIHRFPSNTRDNSAEITRECVWASNTQQQRRYKLLMWLNAIIFNTLILLFFTLCLCACVIKIYANFVWFEYFPCLSHSHLDRLTNRCFR